ncbi:MAG TPA: hypothetical protein VMM56_07220 [Planctomycetaceae bacterium]|nr:hypothetical protein [Planctomycetaceae bacterium]
MNGQLERNLISLIHLLVRWFGNLVSIRRPQLVRVRVRAGFGSVVVPAPHDREYSVPGGYYQPPGPDSGWERFSVPSDCLNPDSHEIPL